jgi:CRP-like cAMP-binding protein
MEAYSANWIGELPPEVRATVLAQMKRRSFAAGEVIYRAGSHSFSQYQIIDGLVQFRGLTAEGKEVLYVVYGPGDCFGYTSAINGHTRSKDAIASGNVVLNCLGKREFDALRDRFPVIDRTLTIALSYRMRELSDRYETGARALQQRLASQIIFLANYTSKLDGDFAGFDLALTHEMLATSVAATRQSVNKLLREWGKLKIVEYHYGRIHILDRKRLLVIADHSDDSQ